MIRIGVDLGGTKVAAVRLPSAAQAEEVWLREPTPQGDYEGTLRLIADLVDALRVPGQEAAIGIGTPGVARADGRMKNCNSTWLNGQTLPADLARAVAQPVKVANDANCFALAEAKAGAGRGAESVFGVILGTGVGGGFVANGTLVAGAGGLAGEWGHLPLPDFRSADGLERGLADRPCYCGRNNCIETFLSGGGLAQTHEELHGETAKPETIARGVTDQFTATSQLYFHQLARSLAMVVTLLDPERVVLGGGLSNMAALYEPVNAMLPSYVFGGECEASVLQAEGGDAAGAVGAAWLWP